MTDLSAASAFTSLLTESRTSRLTARSLRRRTPAQRFTRRRTGTSRRSGRPVPVSSDGRTLGVVCCENGAPGEAIWFVGGKLNVAVNCVESPCRVRPRRSGGAALDWRTRRHTAHHLRGPARPGVAGCGRARGAWRRSGDRVVIQLPTIPAGVDQHARLRSDRRDLLGRFRRLLADGAASRVEDAGARWSSPRMGSRRGVRR